MLHYMAIFSNKCYIYNYKTSMPNLTDEHKIFFINRVDSQCFSTGIHTLKKL